MKKILVFCLVVLQIFIFCSCGDSELSQSTARGVFGEFDDVGINPNNIKTGYSVTDGENIYFYSDNSIKKLNISTGIIEKILVAGSENSAYSEISKELNLYNGYLYYKRSGIYRKNLETGEEELIIEAPKERTDAENPDYVNWEYTGFSYIENIFIAKGYLFYWETSGWKNTSEGTTRKFYAKNLPSGKVILVAENTISTSVVSDFYYTVDDEYIYFLAETFMSRVSFESIKNEKPVLEEEYYGFRPKEIPVFGIDKFYYLEENYSDEYTWVCFDHETNEFENIMEIDKETQDTYELSHTKFGIGDKAFSLTDKIQMYDVNDPTKYETIYDEDDGSGKKRPEVSVVYNDKIYVVTQDEATLLTVDGTGNVTKTAITEK